MLKLKNIKSTQEFKQPNPNTQQSNRHFENSQQRLVLIQR